MPNILIIEDDSSLRALFREWLSARGHGVLSRADVEPNRGAEVDLAIVDLRNLRTEEGNSVSQVKKAFPNVRVIGLSTQLTHVVNGDSPRAVALGVCALLPKPCSREELLSAVRSAFAQMCP